MPFQKTCALMLRQERPHVFLVAKLRLDTGGRVETVLLTEVDTTTNMLLSAEEVPVSEVVELIHAGHRVLPMFPTELDRSAELRFAVIGYRDGSESIVLEGTSSSGLGMRDIVKMDSAPTRLPSFATASFQHDYRAGDRSRDSYFA